MMMQGMHGAHPSVLGVMLDMLWEEKKKYFNDQRPQRFKICSCLYNPKGEWACPLPVKSQYFLHNLHWCTSHIYIPMNSKGNSPSSFSTAKKE